MDRTTHLTADDRKNISRVRALVERLAGSDAREAKRERWRREAVSRLDEIIEHDGSTRTWSPIGVRVYRGLRFEIAPQLDAAGTITGWYVKLEQPGGLIHVASDLDDLLRSVAQEEITYRRERAAEMEETSARR